MYKSNYEVKILVNGHPIKEYYKDGKTYIEGRKGIEFSLKIKNNGFKKILAVPTIDGLSVLSGKEAGYNSPGYIIDGYDSLIIDGWRTSNSEIAKFYFTNPKNSYSKRTNKKDNLGVIGVAIFREKEMTYTHTTYPPFPNYPQDNIYLCSNAITDTANATSNNHSFKADNANVSQDIGTGFGEYKESYVTSVEFEKESNPDAIFTIFYNIKKQLEKIGIDFRERPKYVAPQAFPNGFCEPPK